MNTNYRTVMHYCLIAIALMAAPLRGDTWNFFFYMDATDRLADMAWKNITDMMRAQPNASVNAMIQLHAYGSTALRYRVTATGLQFIDEVVLSGDPKDDFIAAATWALAPSAADHTMIVLSNHGWGALDPRWNAVEQAWQAAELSIAKTSSAIPTTCPVYVAPDSSDRLSKLAMAHHLHEQHRGFMFDDTTRVYLTNTDMRDALAVVRSDILCGQAIDVVVFDTCMGSMLEIATCVAPSANYLVGVQSCALVDGFDYTACIATLNQGGDPRSVAAALVTAFDQYYSINDPSGIYTCAALDLTGVDTVNNALNRVVDILLQHPEWLPGLQQARDASVRFCLWPIYTDLINFCQLIEAAIDNAPDGTNADLSSAFSNLYAAAQAMVIARCGGWSTEGNAHGFSIYAPFREVDESYINAPFAQQSRWVDLMHTLCTSL